MPSFEELPDDYDVAAERQAPSAKPNDARQVAGGEAALRRGFLNRPKAAAKQPVRVADILAGAAQNQTTAAPVESPQTSAPSSAPKAAARQPVRVADILAGTDQNETIAAPVDGPQTSAPSSAPKDIENTTTASASSTLAGGSGNRAEVAAEQATAEKHRASAEDVEELFEGLRSRLQGGLRRVTAAQQKCEEVGEVLAPLRAKWPSAQLKSSREKATREIDSALAEMRSASNDARRLRSGEERLAADELRRAAEDAMDRVRKVADAAAQREPSEEDRIAATIAAFHGLPLTAKLRVLVEERAAYAVLGTSFLLGVVLMLAVLGELYSAWGCGMRCER
jgi:hypothetical protein